jgi:hypothetical protein
MKADIPNPKTSDEFGSASALTLPYCASLCVKKESFANKVQEAQSLKVSIQPMNSAGTGVTLRLSRCMDTMPVFAHPDRVERASALALAAAGAIGLIMQFGTLSALLQLKAQHMWRAHRHTPAATGATGGVDVGKLHVIQTTK